MNTLQQHGESDKLTFFGDSLSLPLEHQNYKWAATFKYHLQGLNSEPHACKLFVPHPKRPTPEAP